MGRRHRFHLLSQQPQQIASETEENDRPHFVSVLVWARGKRGGGGMGGRRCPVCPHISWARVWPQQSLFNKATPRSIRARVAKSEAHILAIVWVARRGSVGLRIPSSGGLTLGAGVDGRLYRGRGGNRRGLLWTPGAGWVAGRVATAFSRIPELGKGAPETGGWGALVLTSGVWRHWRS